MESLLVIQSNLEGDIPKREKPFDILIDLLFRTPLLEKDFIILSNILKLKSTNIFSEYKSNLNNLTIKEQEVFDCICEGLVPKEIAVKLFIEVSTAKTHRRNIIKKLKIKSFKDWCLYSFLNDLK